MTEPASHHDIDQLAEEVTQLAASRHLTIVPVTAISLSGSGHVVVLDSSDLSAAQFCDLATAAGARLLYVQAEAFTARAYPDPDVDGHHDEVREALNGLCREAERFNGRIRELELAFSAGCVFHCWVAGADWYNSLVDRMAALLPPEEPQP